MSINIIRVFSLALVAAVLFQVNVAAVSDEDVQNVLEMQKALQSMIERVKPAYVFFGRGGSSVCISPDGYLITNNHVAVMAQNSGSRFDQFFFSGGRQFSGTVIWYDPAGDMALVKLDVPEGETVPFVPMGDSDKLKVGDHAVAIGNPFSLGSEDNGWEPTVTFGVISALQRYKGWYSACIQTDAKVNPGNSGGPLFNLQGEVVGINGMIEVDQMRGRQSVGVGYAVPVNQFKTFIKHYEGKFERGGTVRHGEIKGLDVDQNPIGRFGARVRSVAPNTTASKAGFQEGDIITKVQGRVVEHPANVVGFIHLYPEDTEVTIVLERAGVQKEIKVKLDAQAQNQQQPQMDPNSPFLGVGTEPNPGGGVKVIQVVPGSSAAKAELKEGDIILEIAGDKINSPEDLGVTIRKHKVGDKIKIKFKRGDQTKEVEVELTARGNR